MFDLKNPIPDTLWRILFYLEIIAKAEERAYVYPCLDSRAMMGTTYPLNLEFHKTLIPDVMHCLIWYHFHNLKNTQHSSMGVFHVFEIALMAVNQTKQLTVISLRNLSKCFTEKYSFFRTELYIAWILKKLILDNFWRSEGCSCTEPVTVHLQNWAAHCLNFKKANLRQFLTFWTMFIYKTIFFVLKCRQITVSKYLKKVKSTLFPWKVYSLTWLLVYYWRLNNFCHFYLMP